MSYITVFPGAPLTYFNEGGGGGGVSQSDFLGLKFWPKVFLVGFMKDAAIDFELQNKD